MQIYNLLLQCNLHAAAPGLSVPCEAMLRGTAAAAPAAAAAAAIAGSIALSFAPLGLGISFAFGLDSAACAYMTTAQVSAYLPLAYVKVCATDRGSARLTQLRLA